MPAFHTYNLLLSALYVHICLLLILVLSQQYYIYISYCPLDQPIGLDL